MQTAIAQNTPTPPAPLQVTRYYSITASSTLDGAGYIDNRSTATRRNNYHSFRATGTGTWTVTLQYADGVPSGWQSFGSEGVVTNASPASGVGYGLGYHDYIKFAFSGTATVANYFGTKDAWWIPTVSSVVYPITVNQGGTGLNVATTIIDQLYASFALGCAAAVSAGQTLVVTTLWAGLSTQSCAANIQFVTGGILQPASGQTITLSGSISGDSSTHFNYSSSGTIAITGSNQKLNARWWGLPTAAGTLNNAISSATAGSAAFIVPPGTWNTSTSVNLRITQSGISIECLPGANIVVPSPSWGFTVENSYVSIEGCNISHAGAPATRRAINIEGSGALSNITITGNTITGFNIGVFCTNVTNAWIKFNTITDGAVAGTSDRIFCQDNLKNVQILNNAVSLTTSAAAASHVIGVHTFGSGGTAVDTLIQGNQITQGGDNFCIEIGAFGGTAPTKSLVIDNFCKLLHDAGGISLSDTDHSVIAHNILNSNGFSHGFGVVEVPKAYYNVVDGNIELNGIASDSAFISCNGCSYSRIVNNIGFGQIYVGSSNLNFPNNDYNVIDGNYLIDLPGITRDRGLIWLQCNQGMVDGSVSYNTISNNHLIGPASGLTYNAAIALESDFASGINCPVQFTNIHHNYAVRTGGGIQNLTNNSAVSNTITDANMWDGMSTLGGFDSAGPVSHTDFNQPWIITKNLTAQSIIYTGGVFTACSTGAGYGAVGTNCLTNAAGGDLLGSAYMGTLDFQTPNPSTPTAGGTIATITVAAGSFSGASQCLLTNGYGTDIQGAYAVMSDATHILIQPSFTGTLLSNTFYRLNIACRKN